VWASESVPVGTVLLRLRARDRDIGRNARIVYEFSQHTAEQYGHLFGIKADSGKIYVKNNLDFEVNQRSPSTTSSSFGEGANSVTSNRERKCSENYNK